MDNQNLNDYIKTVIKISFMTNKYINDEEPWKLKKNNIEKMNNILHISLQQIAKISILLNPIIPIATEKVLKTLSIEKTNINLESLKNTKALKPGIKLKKTDVSNDTSVKIKYRS